VFRLSKDATALLVALSREAVSVLDAETAAVCGPTAVVSTEMARGLVRTFLPSDMAAEATVLGDRLLAELAGVFVPSSFVRLRFRALKGTVCCRCAVPTPCFAV
jgi:hypothetical protein